MSDGVALSVVVNANLDELRAKMKDADAIIQTTEASMKSMANAFDGARIISNANAAMLQVQAIGGATKLTAEEQAKLNTILQAGIDKYTALGKDVPPQMLALAGATNQVGKEASTTQRIVADLAAQVTAMFSVGAVVAFGREVLNAGSFIQKMADQTGMNTTEVQKLKFVAEQADTSIESMVGAVQNLQQRLGNDDDGAAGAMKHLRINTDDFLKLSTYNQLVTLATAIQALPSPTDQASTSAALFGKTWKEILPAIKSGMADVAEQAPIMADETIKSLDRIDDTLKKAKSSATSWGGSIVLAIEGAGYAFGQFLSVFNLEHLGESTDELLARFKRLNDPDGFRGALGAIPPLAAKADDSIKATTMSIREAMQVSRDLASSAERAMAANQAREKAQADADEIAMISYEKRIRSLETLTQATLQAYSFSGQIAQLQALAAAEDDLSRHVYDQLTSEKDRAKVIEETTARHIVLTEQRNAIERKELALTNAGVVEAFEKQTAYNKAMGWDAAGNILQQVTALDTLEARLLAISQMHTTEAAKITLTTLAHKDYEKSIYQTAVAEDALIQKTNQSTEALKAKTQAQQALITLTFQGNALGDKFKGMSQQQLIEAGYVSKFDLSVTALGASVGLGYGPGGLPPSRDSGGAVSAGQSYYVGTRAQPELFVPSTSGTMYPAGSQSAAPVINIHVTQPLGTPQAIARAVDEAMTRRLSGTGIRFPTSA